MGKINKQEALMETSSGFSTDLLLCSFNSTIFDCRLSEETTMFARYDLTRMTAMQLLGCLLLFSFGIVLSEEICNPCQTPDCSICTLGWFGPNCSSFCPENCFDGCNKTGACIDCRPNYYGPYCGEFCPSNCRPSEKNSVACDQTTGACLLGCDEGFWGPTCIHSCSPECIRDVCIQDTGECANRCRDGLVWDKSKRNCVTSLFLLLRATVGTCTDGFYGGDCDLPCSSSCKESSCAFNSSGNFLVCTRGCVDGRTGPYCEQRCPRGCERCSQTGRCESSPRTDCEYACRKPTCSDCLDGFYGLNCERTCPVKCKDVCNKSNGSCSYACEDGFCGPDCTSTCPSNCRGSVCDQSTATCTGGCEQGWHGVNCTHTCSHGCSPNICYQTTGECTQSCVEGYSGARCDTRCVSKCRTCHRDDSSHCISCSCSNYSPNCDWYCFSGCLHTACPACSNEGACLAGCMDGRWGGQCEHVCPTSCEKCDQRSGQCVTWHADERSYVPLVFFAVMMTAIPPGIVILDRYNPFTRIWGKLDARICTVRRHTCCLPR